MGRKVEHKDYVEAPSEPVDQAAHEVRPRAVPEGNVDVLGWSVIAEGRLLLMFPQKLIRTLGAD